MQELRTTIEQQAERLEQILRDNGVDRAMPNTGIANERLVTAIGFAVEEKAFSLSAVMHIQEPVRTAIIEYLNGDRSQGYDADGIDPKMKITLKNVCHLPVTFTRNVRQVKRTDLPKRVRGFELKSNGRHAVYKQKRISKTLQPGETTKLPVGRAITLLGRYCPSAHAEEYLQSHSYICQAVEKLELQPNGTKIPIDRAEHVLAEVGGYLTPMGSADIDGDREQGEKVSYTLLPEKKAKKAKV